MMSNDMIMIRITNWQKNESSLSVLSKTKRCSCFITSKCFTDRIFDLWTAGRFSIWPEMQSWSSHFEIYTLFMLHNQDKVSSEGKTSSWSQEIFIIMDKWKHMLSLSLPFSFSFSHETSKPIQLTMHHTWILYVLLLSWVFYCTAGLLPEKVPQHPSAISLFLRHTRGWFIRSWPEVKLHKLHNLLHACAVQLLMWSCWKTEVNNFCGISVSCN